jgi:hypothetical protein
MPDNIVVEGNWGTVEYAIKLNGKMPAKEFIDTLTIGERIKVSHPLKQLAELGRIFNPEKFRKIKGMRESIFEIKSDHIRILCFQMSNCWVLTNGFRKGDPPRTEFQRAENIGQEHLKVVARKGR